EMMNKAAKRIESAHLKATPEAELQLRRTIGEVYIDLAENDAAGRMLKPVIGMSREISGTAADSRETALSLKDWGAYQKAMGNAKEADEQFSQSIEMLRKAIPGDSKDLMQALSTRGELLL